MGAYWTIKRDEDVEDIKTVKPFEESKVKSNMRQYPPKVDFDGMEETVIPHFKGGEKEFAAKMFVDELNKIMRGRLIPGGFHRYAHPRLGKRDTDGDEGKGKCDHRRREISAEGR